MRESDSSARQPLKKWMLPRSWLTGRAQLRIADLPCEAFDQWKTRSDYENNDQADSRIVSSRGTQPCICKDTSMKTRQLLLACVIASHAPALVQAQGTFQNLDFESASVVPIPGDLDARIQFSSAFPGWLGYVGGVPRTAALYNRVYMDTSGFSLIEIGWPSYPSSSVIEGNFTALLMAGGTGPFATPADTTLSQTSLVPVSAESLQFRAYSPSGFPLRVVLGGQQLALTPLGSGTNYTLYGADIHAWQGHIAQLDFTLLSAGLFAGNNYLFLDSIQFFPQAIPEPGTSGLIVLSGLLLSWRFLSKRP